MPTRRQTAALVLSLGVWALVDLAQAQLPLSLRWAVLDELGHAAVAAFVMVWTWPTWGWRPTLAALLAATLIDVDHPLAARSVAPALMMSLSSRPAGHSLLGVLVAGSVGTLLAGRRVGYGAAIGLLTHIARDAQAEPGVPLLVPLVANWHQQLPIWVLPGLVVSLSALSVTLSTRWMVRASSP